MSDEGSIGRRELLRLGAGAGAGAALAASGVVACGAARERASPLR